MKKIHLAVYATLFIILYSPSLSAQQFLWGVSGGSTADAISGVSDDERVYDITTDVNGNVYALSAIAASNSSYLGQTLLSTYSSPTYPNTNLLITSYSCNGVLRWKKIIGGDASCVAQSIRTDNQGHVYVMGHVYPVADQLGTPLVKMHFDADTTLPYDLYKKIFIVQYDTSGNYKWLRMPQSDTTGTGTFYKAASYDMAVDNSGDLNVITFLKAGSIGNSTFSVATSGLYILKYNSLGTVLSVNPPAGFNIPSTASGYPNAAFESFRMNQSANGNWIISGSQSPYAGVLGFTIGGQLVNHPGFVGAFNSQWQYLWHTVDSCDFNRYFEHPVTDASNNVYIGGIAYDDYLLFGDTVYLTTPGGAPFVVKLNSNGNKIWGSHASSIEMNTGGCTANTTAQSIALTTGGDIAVTGGCGGLKWGNLQVGGQCNTHYNTYVARLNSNTGLPLKLDTVLGGGNGNFTPGGNFGSVIAAGKNNNVYVGGHMTYGQVAGNSVMNYIGGVMDFFIIKQGFNCSCIVPTALFTKTVTGKTSALNYIGTTAGVDSLVWNFGDGQVITKKGAAISAVLSHSYATAGAYTVCVTAYSPCGNHQICQTIQAVSTTGIGMNSLPAGVKVYPNPSSDYLIIEGAAASTMQLINIIGQPVISETVTGNLHTISTENLPAGNYILLLVGRDGGHNRMVITKN